MDPQPAGGRFTAFEQTRARHAADAMIEAFMGQVPGGYWIAVDLNTGKTDGNAYPTKEAAIGHQRGDRDKFAYITLPHDGIVEAHGVAAFLRMASAKEAYWRKDADLHLVIPSAPIVNGGGYNA